MIETRRLKTVVILIKTVLSFVLSRKILNIDKYGTECLKVTVKDLREYEKLECKKNQLKLDIEFLKNCK